MPQPGVRSGTSFSTIRISWYAWLALTVLAAASAAPAAQGAESFSSALATLQKVGHAASGNRAATRAWAVVAAVDAAQMPKILAALDDAGPLAANYLRAAIDAVAERTLAQGQSLPHEQLQRFVLDTDHAPRSRRLAFEWLAKIDPTAPDRLTPGFLNDPSLELRRDAVARLFTAGTGAIEKATGDQQQLSSGIATLRRALAAARDLDQIEQIDKELTRLKQDVDLLRHFGFIASWHLIGPFDNRKGIGYQADYPPEDAVDFAARYPGKKEELAWLAHTTSDRQGKVDLNQALGKDMGCVAYAAAEFYSPREQEVDLRWGSSCATRLWLNGESKANHPVYHTGESIDQYQSRAVLRPGRNVILLKVCQNEQTQTWAQDWDFRFRVCDAIGTAIYSAHEQQPANNKPREARDEKQQTSN
jgi:hypothetical protein